MAITDMKTRFTSKKYLIFFGVFVLMAIIALIFAVTSFGGQQYLQNCSNTLCRLVLSESYRIRPSLDPLKIGYDRLFTGKPGTLNMKVSRKDIAAYNRQIRRSINSGFHGDEWKEWRTVDLQIGSEDFKNVKMKLHGTSTTPIRLSSALSSFPAKVLKKLGADFHQEDLGLAELNASFKLKLQQDKFFNGVRRFTLITSNDDWTAGSVALTKMAKRLGSVVSEPALVQGNFNGYDAGVYLLSEEIDKELLERNYGITNFGMLKSNDVWNKALGIPHISMTDYTSHDKEQSGGELASEYALGQFEILMRRLKVKDVEGVMQLVDLDDFARFSAFEHFYGKNHSSSGDNLRYLYDFSSGKFRLVLRIEGEITERASINPNDSQRGGKSNLTSFDLALEPYDNNRIFQLLLASKDYHQKRRLFLDYISKNKDLLINDHQEVIDRLNELSRNTSKGVQKKINASIAEREILSSNINSVETYLNYHKFYVTHVSTNSTLEIINESTFPAKLAGIEDCEGEFHIIDEKAEIPPNYFRQEWLTPKKIEIAQEITCINKVSLETETTDILQKHIHINRRRDSPNFDVTFSEFNELFENKVVRLTENDWRVPRGNYAIDTTIFLPSGVNLQLEPGVEIELGADVGLLVKGNLTAVGNNAPIRVVAANENKPFASFAVLGSKRAPNEVRLVNFHISGGSEGIFDSVYFSGQMSIHYANVRISKSHFSRSHSDDGLNVKYAKVTVKESEFYANIGDQLDCDFCKGELYQNNFSGRQSVIVIGDGTDGLDVSGSALLVKENTFSNFTDKGISVGELSEVSLINNSISQSNIGIAVKDGSIAELIGNELRENRQDIAEYVKKRMYPAPKVLHRESTGAGF